MEVSANPEVLRTNRPKSQPRTKPGFFFAMASLCVLYAFGGFTPTYFAPLASGTFGPVTPVVHIHGILFFSWTLVFLLQTWLINRSGVAVHRSVGMGGISLATAMVIVGAIVSLQKQQRTIDAGLLDLGYSLGLSGLLSLIGFGVMFALAIRYIRRPDYHKRLMLMATCMLMNAPIARLYRPMFNPRPPVPWLVNATVDIILVALLLYDWKSLRRPHVVTVGAGLFLLSKQSLVGVITATGAWRSLYDTLLQLVA